MKTAQCPQTNKHEGNSHSSHKFLRKNLGQGSSLTEDTAPFKELRGSTQGKEGLWGLSNFKELSGWQEESKDRGQWASAHPEKALQVGHGGFQAQHHLDPSQETSRTKPDGGEKTMCMDFPKAPKMPLD